jgi:membrane-bound metal-dependent hydrolase YbcI (DUF457 family)
MFLGHYAAALGAKKLAPKASLGTLFAAAAFLDLVWPFLVIAGLEVVKIEAGATAFTPLDFAHYPYSHSLLTSALWGCVFGLAVYIFAGRDRRAAAVVAALVVSHWFIDAIAHRPDLPLTPWSDGRVGMALWNSVPATLAIELILFGLGLWLYTTVVTPARRWALPAFAAFLLLIYFSAAFGPLPPSADAVAFSALGQWLFVAAAAWVDLRSRASVPVPA